MVLRANRQASKRRILIAEDSRTQAEHLSALLEESGFEVRVAGDGVRALAEARADPPHLIISDINMPGMDGYSLCRALKTDDHLKSVPVILVTSMSSPADVIRGLEAGADNFITKPYDEESLIARVNYLLTNSALRSESRVRSGIEIDIEGSRHFITAERHQILDLLISTYATAVRFNNEAMTREDLLQSSYQTVKVLQRSAEGLNRVQSEAEAVNEVLNRCGDLPFLRGAWIMLIDDNGKVRRCDSTGLTTQEAANLALPATCDCLRDLRAGKLVGIGTVTTCARLAASPPATSDQYRHATVPLAGQSRDHGVFCAVRKGAASFTDDETRVLSALANQFAAALDRTDLNAALERKVEERTEALRQSREGLARAQRVGRVGSADLDLRTLKITWSDELFNLLGLDPATVPATMEAFLTVIPPEDHAFARDVAARMRTGLDIESFEFRVVRPDGTERWFYRVTETFRDNAGTPTNVSSTLQDITERKRAEEEMRRSLDSLARGQRIGHWGSIDTDLRTNESLWSDGIYDVLGLPRDGTKSTFQRILALVHPDDREMVIRSRDEISHASGIAANEFRIIRPDGELRWIQRLGEIVRDDKGLPVRRAVTFHDITARKQMEDELLRSREHLELAQHVGNIGSAAVDLRTDEAYWSDEMYRMFDLDPATTDRTFETVLALAHPDDRDKLKKIDKDSFTEQDSGAVEFRIVTPNGETRWLLRQSRIIRDANGQPATLLITIQDITAQKKSEREKEELAAQLTQSQKMEAVGNLTGGIAHDFNNILAVIIGNLDLLGLEIPEGTEARQLIETGIAACEKGSELTKSLLAFSRRQPLQPKHIQLNALLAGSVRMMRRAIGEAVDVQLKLGDVSGPVNIDPSLLESALLNMMVNARDAMPNGGVIVIETQDAQLDEAYANANAEVTPGNYALLAVSDNGHGMPPEVLKRVFEPFFTTKPKGKGTGLGLAMVFGFVKQSGGHIKIYSEVGHGTTIRIYLPRADASTVVHNEESGPQISVRTTRGETILVVEDNPDVRRGVLKQLRGVGYRVIEAENVKDALKALEQESNVDLVFSDVIMPGGRTGADLAREVHERWPATKVLLTSGFPEGLLENGNKLPESVVLLGKPYRMDELFRKLRELLNVNTAI